MTIEEVQDFARQNRILLTVVSGKLTFRAPKGKITEEVRETLRQHKEELIRRLQPVEERLAYYKPLIEAAQENRLPIEPFTISDFETITNANTCVIWACGEVRRGSHHSEHALSCLSLLLQRYRSANN